MLNNKTLLARTYDFERCYLLVNTKVYPVIYFLVNILNYFFFVIVTILSVLNYNL